MNHYTYFLVIMGGMFSVFRYCPTDSGTIRFSATVSEDIVLFPLTTDPIDMYVMPKVLSFSL